MTTASDLLPANTGVMPVSPAGNSAVFAEVATPSVTVESTYEKARRAAVLAHAERKREAAAQGYEYHPYSAADSDGYFLSDMEPESAELGPVSRESWAYPLAYVHGGLPTSAHSVASGKAFNAAGVWERSSLARVVQHVPSTVRLLDGSTVVEMPTGVMARRCMAYIASRVIETGSREFFIPSQAKTLARAVGLPSLSSNGCQRALEVFRMCLGLRTVIRERTKDGSEGEVLHAFSVAANPDDPEMGVHFASEGNPMPVTRVKVSEEYFSYVTGGNIVAIPSDMWEGKAVRSSAAALDVLAFVVARASTQRSAEKKTGVWVAWKHMTRQFASFANTIHKTYETYRKAVEAVRTLFVAIGSKDTVSQVGHCNKKGFKGFVVNFYRFTQNLITPTATPADSTLSPTIKASVNRATLNEAAAEGEPVLVPVKAEREGSNYRAVNLALLSTKVENITGQFLPALSDEWERIVDTVMERYIASAEKGNVKPVGNWTAYVEAAIKNDPKLLEEPVPARQVTATYSNLKKADDGLPVADPASIPTSKKAARKDTTFGNAPVVNEPNTETEQHVTTSTSTMPAVAHAEFDVLTARRDEDEIITLKHGTNEHYAYVAALNAGQVIVNTTENWNKNIIVPPVRIKDEDGNYTYPHTGTNGGKSDEWYCRQFAMNDYYTQVNRTIRQLLAERNENAQAAPETTANTNVAPWDADDTLTVDENGYYRRADGSYVWGETDYDDDMTAEQQAAEEEYARTQIEAWINNASNRKPLLGAEEPETIDGYPIMYY